MMQIATLLRDIDDQKGGTIPAGARAEVIVPDAGARKYANGNPMFRDGEGKAYLQFYWDKERKDYPKMLVPRDAISIEDRPVDHEGDLYRKIAEALASYECDEPHVGVFGDQDQVYPDFPYEKIRDGIEDDHVGDCTNDCMTCVRCYLEAITHKARWIADYIEKKENN